MAHFSGRRALSVVSAFTEDTLLVARIGDRCSRRTSEPAGCQTLVPNYEGLRMTDHEAHVYLKTVDIILTSHDGWTQRQDANWSSK